MTPRPPPPPSSSSSPATSFPILATSILGILATSLLLLSYYIFVTKCCQNWRRSDALSLFARSSASPAYSRHAVEHRGLEESAIQSIPTLKYRKISERGGGASTDAAACHECAVCLNEFQEEERIRILPSCFHVFHIDCIDVWLQTHASCPFCRTSITNSSRIQADAIMAAMVPHNHDHIQSEDLIIEVGEDQRDDTLPNSSPTRSEMRPEHANAGYIESNIVSLDELVGAHSFYLGGLQGLNPSSNGSKKLGQISNMGDEWIETMRRSCQDHRKLKIEQPMMRRSFSLDSSGDAQLYLAVQKILQQNRPHFPHFQDDSVATATITSESGSSSSTSGRLRRSFFSFGRSSRRTSVLPVHL